MARPGHNIPSNANQCHLNVHHGEVMKQSPRFISESPRTDGSGGWVSDNLAGGRRFQPR